MVDTGIKSTPKHLYKKLVLAVEHGDLKGVTVQNIPSYRSVHTILYRWKQGHFPCVPRLLTDIPTNKNYTGWTTLFIKH